MTLDDVQRNRGSAKTVEQLPHSDSPETWDDSSAFGKIHDQEEYHLNHSKKLSVLARVKESAKKWKQLLVRKQRGKDGNHTPSLGVALEDYDLDEDTDSPPSHQSRNIGTSSNTNERQKAVSCPTFSDKNNTSSITKNANINLSLDSISPRRKNKPGPSLSKSLSNHEEGSHSIPRMTISESLRFRFEENHPNPTETVSETLINAKTSDIKHKDKLLCPEITVKSSPVKTEDNVNAQDNLSHSKGTEINNVMGLMEELEKRSPTKMKASITEKVTEISSTIQGLAIGSSKENGEEKKWDKGVLVKEYIKQKLEPGEDERELSQVITEVISPKRSPEEQGVVEKMKTAVTLLLQSDDPSISFSSFKSSDSLSNIPVSTNAHEVEEENQGRVLQAN